MKKFFIVFMFICAAFYCKAQIGLGITTPHPNAYFQINSINKGVLLPRMTALQRIAIAPAATANGLIVFDTDSSAYMFWTGSAWRKMGGSDDDKWNLHGNLNTNPPSSLNNVAINYTTDTYLGSPDAKDVSLVAGGNELLRLKQFSTGGRIGLSNRNPEYSLDIRATEINNETQIQGMRLIAKSLFDILSASNVDKGLVLGYNPADVNEMAVWNHANNINGSIRFGLDAFNGSILPAFSITGTGQGINQKNPLYFLDIHSESQFAAANSNPLNKNGIRISYPNQGAVNNMQRGLLMGLATNGDYKSYIWNYDDGSGFYSPSKSILFGIGEDNNRPTIQMQDGILGIGHVKNGAVYPSVLNIQTNYTHSLSKKGMSIINDNTANDELAYMGLDETGNLELSKFISGDINFKTGSLNRLTIKADGNIGIGSITPLAKLDIEGNIRIADGTQAAGRVLTSDANGLASWQNTPGSFWEANGNDIYNSNTGNVGIGNSSPITPLSFQSSTGNKISLWGVDANNHYGFGIQASLLQIYSAGFLDDIAFGYGGSDNFAERMRIKGNGNVGIGTSSPNAPLQLANTIANRKMVLYDLNNNDHQYYGLGINGGLLRYQVDATGADHAFFAGSGTTTSAELMRIKGNGNVGIGASDPAYRLDVSGRIRIRSGGDINSTAGVWLNNIANNVSPAFVGMVNDNAVGFYGNTTPNGWGVVMEITTGNVGIGTSIPSQKLHVIGNILATGTITPSDIRYKNTITAIQNPLLKLAAINGVTYFMNSAAHPEWQFDSTRQYGLIAQEVEKVFPEMVKTISADGYKGLDYVKLVPVLLEGIKELDKKNQKLTEENEQVKERLKSLEEKVNALLNGNPVK